MQVEEWNVQDVKPYPRNPRKNQTAIKAVAKQINVGMAEHAKRRIGKGRQGSNYKIHEILAQIRQQNIKEEHQRRLVDR